MRKLSKKVISSKIIVLKNSRKLKKQKFLLNTIFNCPKTSWSAVLAGSGVLGFLGIARPHQLAPFSTLFASFLPAAVARPTPGESTAPPPTLAPKSGRCTANVGEPEKRGRKSLQSTLRQLSRETFKILLRFVKENSFHCSICSFFDF